MALTKVKKDDYEVRGEYKHINVRTKTSIMEDGVEISYKYHRKSINTKYGCIWRVSRNTGFSWCFVDR